MSTQNSNLLNYNKTQWGNVALLAHLNYDSWMENMTLVLKAMRVYSIVTGKPEPQALDINYADWKTHEAQAATTILLSCSLDVRVYVKGLRNPHEMWHTLQQRLDNTTTLIGRTALLRKFRATRHQID
ncbi:hypothetical protein K440DRAFT_641100 [Wilcoxina mikolae CBS 423.85]|nr:hypothetical protein K440DRAFT_641100 [Wilcoxina mikolae CBS 423.85]